MSRPAFRVTILGSGSSSGVPRLGANGADWGACDPGNPKNRRRRCSILIERGPIEQGKTAVLIDTAPDMREQLIDARCGLLDGVLFTHEHADQSHGIDDLRMVAQNMMRRVDVYGDDATLKSLTSKFDYCFKTPSGSSYPPILNAHLIAPFERFAIHGAGGAIDILPFDQDHGAIRSLGFRIGPVAYTSDAVDIPPESFAALEGIECWIVDALRYRPHATHAHVDLALSWIERVGAKRGVLTNLHIDLDYETLRARLPSHVEPAYDGMVLNF